MSKKAKLYLLIIINLLAWGFVGYKIYGALQGDDELSFENTNTSIKKIDEAAKEDTIVLSLNYPDPFLKGGIYSKEQKRNSSPSFNHTNSNPKVEKNTVKTPSIIATQVLDIKYVGLVKNSDKGTETAMITINGKSYFVKKKDVIEGMIIEEIRSDALKIKKGKEILIINK